MTEVVSLLWQVTRKDTGELLTNARLTVSSGKYIKLVMHFEKNTC